MNYDDGRPVMLGDKVVLTAGMTGVVVAVIEAGQYSSRYNASEWEYLAKGVLVESPEAGLVHYDNIGSDFSLVERGC
jgi:hypothetical protein